MLRVSSYDPVHIYVMQRQDVFLGLMELKWQASIYHFSVVLICSLFEAFHAFSLKVLPAAPKGTKCRKHGFLHMSASEPNI